MGGVSFGSRGEPRLPGRAGASVRGAFGWPSARRLPVADPAPSPRAEEELAEALPPMWLDARRVGPDPYLHRDPGPRGGEGARVMPREGFQLLRREVTYFLDRR